MATQLAPGVYVKDVPSGIRSIVGAGTSTPAFLGFTKQSTENSPTLVRSWSEFDKIFVPPTGGTQAEEQADIVSQEEDWRLAEAVMGYFSNGGASCYIVPISSQGDALTALRGDKDKKTGLNGLETVGDVSMVAVPDMHILANAAMPQGTLFAEDTDPAIIAGTMNPLAQEVVEHCAKMGNRVAVLDAPPGLTSKQLKDFRNALSVGSHKDFATLYYPWVTVPGVGGTPRTAPPSGHICGVWAATDAARGVFKAPANVSLTYAIDLANALSDDEQGELNAEGVNCLRSFPGRPLLVWGARTLADASDRDWKYLSVRRLVCFLADSLKQSTSWAVFEPNDERLWSTLRHSCSAFLKDQWCQGALQGATQEEAFHVVCDKSNNPQESIDLGEVHCDIYVAPVRPAEFIHFSIQQTAGQAA
jgi:phage tail sheath protein FI